MKIIKFDDKWIEKIRNGEKFTTTRDDFKYRKNEILRVNDTDIYIQITSIETIKSLYDYDKKELYHEGYKNVTGSIFNYLLSYIEFLVDMRRYYPQMTDGTKFYVYGFKIINKDIVLEMENNEDK